MMCFVVLNNHKALPTYLHVTDPALGCPGNDLVATRAESEIGHITLTL